MTHIVWCHEDEHQANRCRISLEFLDDGVATRFLISQNDRITESQNVLNVILKFAHGCHVSSVHDENTRLLVSRRTGRIRLNGRCRRDVEHQTRWHGNGN